MGINFKEYAADRQAKLGSLVKDLRSSEAVLKEFKGSPNVIAKKHGLALTDEEAAKLYEVATAKVSGQIGTDALEAVSGGIWNNENCPCS